MGAAAGRQDGSRDVADCSVPSFTQGSNTSVAMSCEDISVYRKCCLACKLGSMTRKRIASTGIILNRQCRAIASTAVNCDQSEAFLQCCIWDSFTQVNTITKTTCLSTLKG